MESHRFPENWAYIGIRGFQHVIFWCSLFSNNHLLKALYSDPTTWDTPSTSLLPLLTVGIATCGQKWDAEDLYSLMNWFVMLTPGEDAKHAGVVYFDMYASLSHMTWSRPYIVLDTCRSLTLWNDRHVLLTHSSGSSSSKPQVFHPLPVYHPSHVSQSIISIPFTHNK